MLDKEVIVMMFWPFMVVGSIAVILLAVIAGGPRLFAAIRRRSVSLRCPSIGREVTADLAVSEWDGAALDVYACSAFTPPTAVTCDRRCLALAEMAGRTPGHPRQEDAS